MYEAAEAFGLPIQLHPGGTGLNLGTGAGWPSFYYEDHCGVPLAVTPHLASMVCNGVFERFPKLRVALVECGWSWFAPFLWRFDRAFEELRAEVPHLQRRPSEYLKDHLWFTTQPIEEPETPEQFVEALDHAGIADRLMYSSDYPHWDFDPPEGVLPGTVPGEVQRKIFRDTALALYGLPSNRVVPVQA
jgi:predicted TIM-barrel fold metal-dependent hydrolase